jgi:diguanylate cyclase
MELYNGNHLEQMETSAADLEKRKSMFNIDQQTCAGLLNVMQTVAEKIDEIIAELHQELNRSGNIKMLGLITSQYSMKELAKHQCKYILELFSGNYDLKYVNSRLKLGCLQERIGISPDHCLSAGMALKKILQGVVSPSTFNYVDRIVMLDISYVLDSHFHNLVSKAEKKRKFSLIVAALERQKSRKLSNLARQDPLTNLLNVRILNKTLMSEIQRSNRTLQGFCVLYMDINNFKTINDTMGHGAGDEVIIKLAAILNDSGRKTDYAFRCGGDEFCVIAINTSAVNAKALAQKYQKAFISAYPDYSLSIGISEYIPNSEMSVYQLMKEADKQMYMQKTELKMAETHNKKQLMNNKNTIRVSGV